MPASRLMGLLSLPDEVLEIALKYLLPPFRSQSLAETYVFTVPVDLLSARLVSRRFHRIATPFAWRRAQLQIASPAATYYGNFDAGEKTSSAALATATKHSLRSLARCHFFHNHPELAAHVRVLLVSLEWHAEGPELARDALKAATRAMSSLRTVLVWDADVLPFRDIRQLLQRPLLRAVRLMDVDGSAFPAQCDWGAGLKMLHIANSVSPARLIAGAAATLECVSIELARACPEVPQPTPTLRDMPWKTLKEVSLVDCVNDNDWSSFLQGFELHRRLRGPAALTELMIGDLGGLEPVRVAELLSTFQGQRLRRLTLYHILGLDPATVSRIVSAFPGLHDLTLLTEGALAPWPGTLDEYAQKFACLPHLTTLSWNNFLLDSLVETAFPSLSDAALSVLYVTHVQGLARRVRSLHCVKLTSVTDGVVDTVWIGDSRTSGKCTVDAQRSTEVALHTSSWSTTSEAFEDI